MILLCCCLSKIRNCCPSPSKPTTATRRGQKQQSVEPPISSASHITLQRQKQNGSESFPLALAGSGTVPSCTRNQRDVCSFIETTHRYRMTATSTLDTVACILIAISSACTLPAETTEIKPTDGLLLLSLYFSLLQVYFIEKKNNNASGKHALDNISAL